MINYQKRRQQAVVAAIICAHGYQLVQMFERRSGRLAAGSVIGPSTRRLSWSGRSSWKSYGRAELLGQSTPEDPVEDIARQIEAKKPANEGEIFMKRFKVRVDNQMFYVEVEEIPGEGETVAAPIVAAPIVASRPTPKSAPVAKPTKAVAPAAAPRAAAPAAGGAGITAPMPGTILDVKVEVGQSVNAGDNVVILEAMKMENELKADKSGTVKEVRVKKGQTVNAGEVLIVIG
ncbi:biotin carboxyl carrier protein [Heliophilum fasciatum]|uniref:Biotin carboxyl carrier protein n=2 Tax=Heliophilum fasciatum TaxID=35700 RepID=A0A4R2RW81_9FIRM|nr:biotin carboxyl carrier protein [Heliophilum fasciatum]